MLEPNLNKSTVVHPAIKQRQLKHLRLEPKEEVVTKPHKHAHIDKKQDNSVKFNMPTTKIKPVKFDDREIEKKELNFKRQQKCFSSDLLDDKVIL